MKRVKVWINDDQSLSLNPSTFWLHLLIVVLRGAVFINLNTVSSVLAICILSPFCSS